MSSLSVISNPGRVVGPLATATTAASEAPTKPEQPKHEPSRVRDVVEKAFGVFNAAGRIPQSFISGLAVGGFQGARKGSKLDTTVKAESVAIGLVACNALQSVAQGAIGGYLLLGPTAALINGAKEAGQAGFNTYLFVKGGSAKEMGEEMAAAINAKVEPGAGGVEGAFKGALAGSTSGVKAGAKTGFAEGRGTASGVLEGLKEIPREFAQADGLKGPFWKRILSSVTGALSAALAAPAGLAVSVIAGAEGKKVPTALRLTTSAASGALLGGLAGAFAGPVGIALGAGVGAVASLLGPSSKTKFVEETASSLKRAQADDGDLGSEVGNNRRDLVQKVITGTLSGARQGWDSGVTAWQPAG